MDTHDFLLYSFIYLSAAVISVPLASRLGLGSVLGYLIAGMVIGPFGLALVGDQTSVMHFAEFGVVMMLFLVGLELRPALLWSLRRAVLGLGGGQVLLTAALLGLAAIVVLDLPSKTAIALGLTLALSSTAIVLQSLAEKGLLKSEAGQNAFSVLLFQDIAVIPIMALFPLLALSGVSIGNETQHQTLISHLPGWAQLLAIMLVMGLIVAGGRWIAFPVFRFIAETRLREIFTAFALLLVITMALLMQAIGLSAALGTFLAGVVLAENEFRHELETDIEPFKGLLLGLFFISVGANIDFSVIFESPALVILCLALLISCKLAVLAALAWVFKLASGQKLLFVLALAQGGEFAFVLGGFGMQSGVFSAAQANLLTVVVALSMLTTPLLLLWYEKLQSRRTGEQAQPQYDAMESGGRVIIAGYGRFGQIVGRLLVAQGFHPTILESSPSQVDMVRVYGHKVFYGDASRFDLLRAAGAAEAELLVVAVDLPDKTLEIISTAKKHFPKLKIVARTIDRRHTYEVMRLGVDALQRETFASALDLGIDTLHLLGVTQQQAERAGALFREHDNQSLLELSELWGDDKSYGVAVRQRLDDLSQVLAADQHANREADANADKQQVQPGL